MLVVCFRSANALKVCPTTMTFGAACTISAAAIRILLVAARPSVFELVAAAFNPSERLEAIAKRANARLHFRIAFRPAQLHADAPHLRFLRACPERPRHRAAEQRDELAPPHHSITSSARASSGSGTVRPSALAVLRLMTSSSFVACWTGRSAGLSPLRMRPVYTPA